MSNFDVVAAVAATTEIPHARFASVAIAHAVQCC